ncbi:MAG: cell division protein ZipA [Pseudomonadales bacterium]|jgi:cell division protein ZipA|nr:cell division protein ZipA [Pseudomonadales bacterium]MDP6471976.1 cell division protein ZipA [Pseudomonadales bacterium]MDP6826753.1 cell division protein ZipA [Pseudomonadales bacterium]MDP6971016.1 cell division protein ZipA [Pseudomonadales bacterium]|tara:strand:- start:870 stop:1811 length:942 start_codon:yes stop_codon:yes gene_type:complete
MDIKSLILIGGGLLIAAVIGHGFWIAWRSRREPYRLDIVPDLIPDDVDEMERLRGELPNGGARVMTKPRQADLDLDDPVPLLLEPTDGPPAQTGMRSVEPSLSQPDPAAQVDEADEAVVVAQVKEVNLPDEPIRATGVRVDRQGALAARVRAHGGSEESGKAPAAGREQAVGEVEELLIIHVLASDGRFQGFELFEAMQGLGLRYGDMNIFHKIHPLSKLTLYSVANAVEPGTFDLSDVDAFSTPGLTFIMQLPGPEEPANALEDMLHTTGELARRLEGTCKDENMSVLTGQTVEHYRQRIADFARRRLSRRA